MVIDAHLPPLPNNVFRGGGGGGGAPPPPPPPQHLIFNMGLHSLVFALLIMKFSHYVFVHS